MARSASLFTGTTAGKVGEVVFFRANGQQRARQYVATVKDRRSESQITQRVMLSPVVQAFRLLKPVLINSFCNAPAVQSGYNAFVSANKSVKPSYFTKLQAMQSVFSFQEYQVSRGTLAPFPAPSYELNKTVLSIGYDELSTFAAFVANYKAVYPDATDNDRITIVVAQGSSSGSDTPEAIITSFGLSENAFPAGVAYASGELSFSADSMDASSPMGTCFIRSTRDVNGKVNTSTQFLKNNDPAIIKGKSFSSGVARITAIDSYGYNADTVL